MKTFSAKLYKNNSSSFKLVDVSFNESGLQIQDENENELIPHFDYHFDTPLANCPLIIELKSGLRIEVDPDKLNYHDIKKYFKSQSKLIYWLENNYYAIFLSFFCTVALIFVSVKFVIPYYSQKIAFLVPDRWGSRIDEQLMKQMDDRQIYPSKIDQHRQDEIVLFIKSHVPSDNIKILFRKFGQPNAFALTHDTVVITDEIVPLMTNDYQLLSIYLHELGHLKDRHLLASIISSSSLAVLSFVIVGDMAGITESLYRMSVVLLNSSYSRKYERAADEYSRQSLKKLGLPLSCLSEAFQNLQKHYSSKVHGSIFFNYLSTHPDFEERISHSSEMKCPSNNVDN